MKYEQLMLALDAGDPPNKETITLVVGKRRALGSKVRLTTGGGPLGEILCVNSSGDVVGLFDRASVRKWLLSLKQE